MIRVIKFKCVDCGKKFGSKQEGYSHLSIASHDDSCLVEVQV